MLYFKATYDTILSDKFYTGMEGPGIPFNLIRLVRCSISRSGCRAKTRGDTYDPFSVKISL